MDNRCSKGNRSSHTNLSKHQFCRDNHPEKEKPQNPQVQKKSTQPPSSGFPRPDSNETSKKKARKEKKKKYHREHNRDSGTPATRVNADEVTSDGAPKDMSPITSFNYNRTGHYARSCPKKRDSSKAPKKLVSVSATSPSVTETSMEDTSLARVPCIHYPVQFRKNGN